MIIEKFFRNHTDDPHWVLAVKAKWGESTSKFLVSFESYVHPALLTETFVCVRIWEEQQPRHAISKEQFLNDIAEMKKRNDAKSVKDLYVMYQEGKDING